MCLHEPALCRTGLSEEKQARVDRGPVENLLVTEMYNMSKMPTIGDKRSQSGAIFGVEELVRTDVGKVAIGFEGTSKIAPSPDLCESDV